MPALPAANDLTKRAEAQVIEVRNTREPTKLEPQNIVTMARDRLAFVTDRIEELRQYEAERAMLRRMLDAADEPQESVRPN